MTDIITRVYEVLQERKAADPESSYVASLYHKGTEAIAAKVSEEAEEAIVEAMKGDAERLQEESADLLFHLMVLWADRGVAPEDVFAILETRFGTSGHEEKAGRRK